MTSLPQQRRFTVEEYHAMGVTGILAPSERVELVEGEVIEMSPIGSVHSDAVDQLTLILVRQAGDAHVVRIQNPIRLGEFSEPQPDAAVVRRRPGGYARQHPSASDILLVAEVSDSTFVFDRNVKLRMYAAAGVSEVWIVNGGPRMLERHTRPAEGVYAHVAEAGPDGEIESTTIPGLVLRTDEVVRA